MACPDTVKTSLAFLVPKDQIAFLKYIWFLKLGISELLVPTQRAHTYRNNRQIVGHERHQLLASERKGTAISASGEGKELLLYSGHHKLVHSERQKPGSVGHSKEYAVKLGLLVTLCKASLYMLPAVEGSHHPGLLTLPSAITMEMQHSQENFLYEYHVLYIR